MTTTATNTDGVAGGLTPAQIDSIMAQAQVFASAWSLVGGQFDSGDMLETAEREKSELRTMLAAARAQATVQPYCYVYEYESAFGLHREFSPREWNAMQPTRTVAVYAVPVAPQAADSEDRDAAKMIADLEAELTYVASSRETCSDHDVPRWDRVQAVIDHLKKTGGL